MDMDMDKNGCPSFELNPSGVSLGVQNITYNPNHIGNPLLPNMIRVEPCNATFNDECPYQYVKQRHVFSPPFYTIQKFSTLIRLGLTFFC